MVRIVEYINPDIMVYARGLNIRSPIRAIGSRLKMAVTDVSNIGRKRAGYMTRFSMSTAFYPKIPKFSYGKELIQTYEGV